MFTFFSIVLAQTAAHILWYVGARAAVMQHVGTSVCLDAAYGLLTVYTYRSVVDHSAPPSNIAAFILGGMLGTAAGVVFPL